jgi:hypothetical protein
MITEQFTDIAGNIRIMWEQPSGVTFHFKFKTQPPLAEIEALADAREQLESDARIEPAIKAANKNHVVRLVELFKERPSITSTQFTTLLNTLPWYEQAEIRTLIYQIGTALADRKEITLASMTEAQFLTRVRDFIVATPARKLARLFLDQFELN